MNEIEQQIQDQPLRPLPEEWKQSILGEACKISVPPGKTIRRRSLVELLFVLIPKPVAIPLAVAWVLITILWISTPASQPSSIAGLVANSSHPVSTDSREEAKKIRTMIWVALHQNMETIADINEGSDGPEPSAFPPDSNFLP